MHRKPEKCIQNFGQNTAKTNLCIRLVSLPHLPSHLLGRFGGHVFHVFNKVIHKKPVF